MASERERPRRYDERARVRAVSLNNFHSRYNLSSALSALALDFTHVTPPTGHRHRASRAQTITVGVHASSNLYTRAAAHVRLDTGRPRSPLVR